MNKLNKCTSVVFIALTIFLLFSFIISTPSVNAAIFSGGRSLGAKPFVYYDSSVANYGYTAAFNTGRSYWNSHSLVSVQRKYSSSGNPDIYYVKESSKSSYGEIIPYTTTGKVDTSFSQWWHYVHVILYHKNMQKEKDKTNSHVNNIAAHEVGHSIKMAHTSNGNSSVMRKNSWKPMPSSRITKYDSSQIDRKWE